MIYYRSHFVGNNARISYVNFITHNFFFALPYRSKKDTALSNGMCANSRAKLVGINKHVVPRSRGFNPDSSSVKSITRLFFYFRLGHLCCETRLISFSKEFAFGRATLQRKTARRFIENSSKLLNDERDGPGGSLCARRKPQTESTTWEAIAYDIAISGKYQYLRITSDSVVLEFTNIISYRNYRYFFCVLADNLFSK